MLRSVFLLGTWMTMLFAGFSAPFIFAVAYLWIDFFSPQRVAYEIMTVIPVALISGAGAMFGYILFDRRDPPKLNAGTVLLALFCVWITLTTTWAEVPKSAWFKWDWAFKTLTFSILIPYVFRTRVQMEAVILVVLASVSGHVLAVAMKTMLSGGYYGTGRALIQSMLGLGESSTLACVTAASIPLLLVMAKHSIIIPAIKSRRIIAAAVAFVFVVACVGSFARTGLVALTVLAAVYFWQSKRKIVFIVLALVAALGALYFIQDTWYDRMYTIREYGSEQSALGRIAVWLWTLEYVAAHPFGGGFDVYLINEYSLPLGDQGGQFQIKSKAFHSIYFEVLGEQGIVGAGLFGLIILVLVRNLRVALARSRNEPKLEWVADLCRALLVSTAVYLAGGAFIGIAYQPFLYLVLGLSISLYAYVERVQAPVASKPRIVARLGDGVSRAAS